LAAEAQIVEIDVLSPDACRALVRARLKTSSRRTITDDQLDELAFLLEYLPLALEIAAIHLDDGMPVDVLVDELSHEIGRLQALTVDDSEDLRRRLSLDATLTLSFKAIDPIHLTGLLLLGVLRQQAPITPEIAAAVVGCSRFDAQKLLAFLAAKSLLKLVEKVGESHLAFRMHDLVRDKCRQILRRPRVVNDQYSGQPAFDSDFAICNFLVDRLKAYKGNGLWSRIGEDPYVNRNLCHHLAEAGDLICLFEVLGEDEYSLDDVTVGNAWLSTQERFGWPNQFFSDCDTGWSLAETRAKRALAVVFGRLTIDVMAAIGHCIEAACIICSIIGQNAGIKPSLADLLMRYRVWTPIQALYALGRSLKSDELVDFVSKLPNSARSQGLLLCLRDLPRHMSERLIPRRRLARSSPRCSKRPIDSAKLRGR
jgi:hypothetical protein